VATTPESHVPVGVAVGLGVLVVGGFGFVMWRRNRAT
jgi:LPXTG-motif cell wall-anchored protein